jgi:hypothetical protein
MMLAMTRGADKAREETMTVRMKLTSSLFYWQVRVATRKMTLAVTVLKNVSPCADCAEELLKVGRHAYAYDIRLRTKVDSKCLWLI